MQAKIFVILLGLACVLPLPAYAQSNPTGTVEHTILSDADGDGFVDPGDLVRFTIKVTNANAAPFEGAQLTIELFSGVTMIESTLSLSQGTVTRGDQRLNVNLGTLAPLSTATITYDETIDTPAGFELPPSVCGNGALQFPDGSSSPLQALNGPQLGFGSCVQNVDFDDDEVVDREEMCVNVPHTSPRLDTIIPSSGSGPIIITHSINITRRGMISAAEVALMIEHSWVGDLIVTLTHVDTGNTVRLIDRPGRPASEFGCSLDDVRATFSVSNFPTAEGSCQGAPSPAAISGFFSAEDSLEAFDGEDMRGEWKLTIEDKDPSNDGGSLTQWCVNLRSATELSASITAPAVSLNNKRFTQSITVNNNGPGDLLDFSFSHLVPFGLSLKNARLRGSTPPGDLPKLVVLPVGDAITVDYEVEPSPSFPYRELIVSSSAAGAGTYQVTQASFGAEASAAGLNAPLVLAAFPGNFGSCTLQNPQELQGKIAMIPFVFCSQQSVIDQVTAAGAIALVLRLNFTLDAMLLVQPIADVNQPKIDIPVVALSQADFDMLSTATGGSQATLRSNPDKPNWFLTSAILPGSMRVDISNTLQLSQALHTKTEIQVDADQDGVTDVNDQCANDPAKSAPGVCGCGTSEVDSDADGTLNCKDECLDDPAKSSAGACGCDIADSDKEANGILDCSTGREVFARYTTLQQLMKGLKPVVPSGNKKKDAKKAKALKAKVLEIKNLVAEIDKLIASPTKPIALADPKTSLATESSAAKKKILSALKTSSLKFSKNKKGAAAALKKMLSVVVNSD